MQIINHTITVETAAGINIYDITPQISKILAQTEVKNGQVLVFVKHTTTAVAINEYEVRLLEDLKNYFARLAPKDDKYLHNDLHLRNVPPDEPKNAHSHLIAMMLNNSETIPVIEGKLGLGTYQSVLFFELDGARKRHISVQITGI